MKIDAQAIILAAGKSTRCKTGKTKLGEKICGQPMILFATSLFEFLKIPTTVVVGYQKECIEDLITKKHGNSITFVEQTEQKGTGHAVLCTQDTWKKEHIIILNGDMPLVTPEIITELYKKHIKNDAAITFVTSHHPELKAHSYGRVVKDDKGIKIVEAKDLQDDIADLCCINAGIYCIKKSFLKKYISELKDSNASNEFYITDLVKIASDKGLTVETVAAPYDCIRGINTLQELWAAEQIKRAELIKYWMDQGVRFSVAQNVHIDLDVSIGAGTFVGCGVHLIKNTKIGKNCKIDEFSSLENTQIGDNVTINSHCIIKDAKIDNNATVGPFAYLRNNVTVGERAEVGTFVEAKQSTFGSHSKAKHLSYIGDTTIGSHTNIGAGTIVCNYDGKNKHRTTIQANVHIGSNNSLVAPLTIETGAFTAAGSVITKDVPKDALAIARSRQINKEGYAKKLFEEATVDTEKTPAPKKKEKTNQNTHAFSFIGARIAYEEPNEEQ